MSRFYDFIGNLNDEIRDKEFSIDLLDICRDVFQYGGFDDEDEEKFKEILRERYFRLFPDGNESEVNILANSCIDRGVFNIRDILITRGTYFVVKYEEFMNNVNCIIESVGSTQDYYRRDYAICDFGYEEGFISKIRLKKLLNNLSDITKKYMSTDKNSAKNEDFPEYDEIYKDWYTVYDSILNVSVEELVKAYESGQPFIFSMMKVLHTLGSNQYLLNECTKDDYMKNFTIRTIDLMYDAISDSFVVTNIEDNNYELLSNRINAQNEIDRPKMRKRK